MNKLTALLTATLFALSALGAEQLPPQPEKDNFLEAYLLALGPYGVKSSYQELACICGISFTPLRYSAAFCGKDAAKAPYSCEYNVQRLNNFYRLRNEERTFTVKDQVSPGKRTEYRKLISDASKEGASAIQYCTLPGQLSPTWQYVEPGTGLTLRITAGGRVSSYSGVPEKVWLMKRSSRPAPSDPPAVFIFENIGKLMNGTTTVTHLNCGAGLLQDTADNAYALPWCPLCKSSFNSCVQKHLLRWQYDAARALELFPWLSQLCSNEEERALLEKARQEYRRYGEMYAAILADPAWERPQTDLKRQSLLGEQIRALAGPLASSAECFFSLANKRNSMSAEYYSPSRRSQLLSDKLANVIVGMNVDTRYEGSLACSLAIAAQLSGCERPAFVLRGVAGLPVRLCLRTNDWHFCREINEGLDMVTPFLNVAGFEARYVSSQASGSDALASENTVKRVYDSAIRKIVETISDKHHAVVGSNLNRSGYWGVIAGYTDHGFTWLGRTASDEKPQLKEFKILPQNVILVGDEIAKQPFEDDVRLAIGRWLKFLKGGSANGCLYGIRLQDFWLRQLLEWERSSELPPPEVAVANRSLWNALIDGRADALEFASHLTTAVPACAIPMGEVKEILEQELSTLRSALNNGYVLGYSGSRYLPPEIKPATISRQADTLRRVQDLDRQLIHHLEIARENLQ